METIVQTSSLMSIALGIFRDCLLSEHSSGFENIRETKERSFVIPRDRQHYALHTRRLPISIPSSAVASVLCTGWLLCVTSERTAARPDQQRRARTDEISHRGEWSGLGSPEKDEAIM
jgi:hypothetical protein